MQTTISAKIKSNALILRFYSDILSFSARVSSIFEQMTPFLLHDLSIVSHLLGQNFKLSKQSQSSSVSNVVKYFQTFGRMLSSFQLLHIIRSCPSRFYEKLTLSTTPENLKAKSWLVFRYHQTNYHFRNHSKKTFFCVQILLKIAHGTTRIFHSNFISKSQILDYNTLKKWKNQIKKKMFENFRQKLASRGGLVQKKAHFHQNSGIFFRS